ncbi:MAG: lipoprotein [Rhodanobacteraceae bacterium]|nr:lipoprotein [Rhodanobacteraceae bacterium]MBK7042559.1 lipoprotein [Rhodanobacteraceae bacterium]MBP9153423.1 lipoprotein [Xanthomonadales bacterium]HQW82085.1 lipoprotein [Pseudomonadota bacterium]
MRSKCLIALVSMCLLLAACGQKGDLVRPEPKPEAPATQ